MAGWSWTHYRAETVLYDIWVVLKPFCSNPNVHNESQFSMALPSIKHFNIAQEWAFQNMPFLVFRNLPFNSSKRTLFQIGFLLCSPTSEHYKGLPQCGCSRFIWFLVQSNDFSSFPKTMGTNRPVNIDCLMFFCLSTMALFRTACLFSLSVVVIIEPVSGSLIILIPSSHMH